MVRPLAIRIQLPPTKGDLRARRAGWDVPRGAERRQVSPRPESALRWRVSVKSARAESRAIASPAVSLRSFGDMEPKRICA
jgi:hypothetical protein